MEEDEEENMCDGAIYADPVDPREEGLSPMPESASLGSVQHYWNRNTSC